MLNGLLDSSSDFPDPRCVGRTRHRFLDPLVIAVCAVVAGAESWVDIADYGQAKKDWLRTFLSLPEGIPSHDTFRCIFSILDPATFEGTSLNGCQVFMRRRTGTSLPLMVKPYAVRSIAPPNVALCIL